MSAAQLMAAVTLDIAERQALIEYRADMQYELAKLNIQMRPLRCKAEQLRLQMAEVDAFFEEVTRG